MAEKNTLEERLIDEKLSGYSYNHDERNFIAPREITVNITLAEYRHLVEVKAAHELEIKKKDDRIRDLEKQTKMLKEKIDELSTKILENAGIVVNEEEDN
jgi:hypothetical protein